SVPERFLEWLDNRDPEMLKDVLNSVLEAGSPGFIPTALLPIMENLSNYNFFLGRAIVPASRQDLPPELQYTRWTSEVSKKLGELLGMSPSKIDNLINGWTGGLGRYALDILGAILKGTGISPDIPEPSPTLADLPVIKSFVVRNPYGSSGKAVNDFYNLRTEYIEGEKFLKEMIKLGEIVKFEDYKASHPELLFFYDAVDDVAYSASARYLRQVASQLSELGKKQDEIFHSRTISSEEKRTLIDEIDKLKTDVARRALDLFLGDIPEVLPSQLNDDINKLGLLDEDIPELLEPEFFNMKNLNTEFGSTLSGVTIEELNKLENIDPLAFAFLEKEEVEDIVNPIPNKTIYQYEPDLAEGVSFNTYFENWQAGLVEDETLDNLTRQQRNLLREYNSLTSSAQVAFLEANPELKDNPRDEWLKAHPKENAQLAIWGQADVLTLEAYNEVKR
ncbi:hypothetical protein LCGC14_2654740, partial [marine sediment metagenome]